MVIQGLRLSLAKRLLLHTVPMLLRRAPEAATVLRLLLGPVTHTIHHSRGLKLLLDSSVLRLLLSPDGVLLLWQCRLGLPASCHSTGDCCCTLVALSFCANAWLRLLLAKHSELRLMQG